MMFTFREYLLSEANIVPKGLKTANTRILKRIVKSRSNKSDSKILQ